MNFSSMPLNPLLEQGFAIFQNVFKGAELDQIGNQLHALDRVGTRGLLDLPWCQSIAMMLKGRLASKLSEVNERCPVQCTYFNKSTEANWLVAFHQDRSIPVDEQTPMTTQGWSRKEGMTFVQPPDDVLSKMLALRLHLDDSGADNGPLRVLPNTHRNGTLSPWQINHYRQSFSPTELEVPRGGVIAMRPLCLHASSKSRTHRPRRVLHFLFGPYSLPNGLKWRHARP